jgi:ribulose-5-phosphate 4-epimerase/fuculose-1-phosphate aldolase
LHLYGAVDGFGHVSVRHPSDPKIYIMCGYMPPALVESEADLIEYYVDGSGTVDPDAAKGYSERYIHGEIFKKYPGVNCVVHSHAESVIPYDSSSIPLEPMYHMAGFMGGPVPVWNIVPAYEEGHQQDMLVNNEHLGASLASAFSPSGSSEAEHTVVLMERHGYSTWGKDIPTACYRAVYTLVNAAIQTRAITIQNAAGKVGEKHVKGLSPRHCRDCQKMTEATQDKSWRLWSREVERNPLYTNKIEL